jgi:hypothetical protein
MANIITAGNSTNGGTAISTDTSGTLNIVTGSGSGANAITIDASQVVTIPSTLAVTGAQTIGGNLTVTGSITGGSISVANSLRAWVNFNGTGTPSIRTSFNVSSITDNGIGDFTINFTTAISDANYSALVNAGDATLNGRFAFSYYGTAPTTTSYRIGTSNFAGSNFDLSYIAAAIFR